APARARTLRARARAPPNRAPRRPTLRRRWRRSIRAAPARATARAKIRSGRASRVARASARSAASRAPTSARSRAPAPRSPRARTSSAAVRQPEHAPRDDVELNLRRAALDRAGARAQPLAHPLELRRRESGRLPAEPLKSRQLDEQLAPPLGQLGAVVLEHRDLRAGARELGRALERQRVAQPVEARLRDAIAQDRIAERAVAPRGGLERLLLRRRRVARVRDQRALVLEQRLGDGPPLPRSTDEVFRRHAHRLEERLAERRRARDQPDRPRRDPRRRHVDEQEADTLVLRRARVGAHQAEHPVRLIGVRGPDLLAVDDVRIAVEDGARLQAGEIGAGARLAVALAPADPAARDRRQVLEALLLRAELE